MQPVGAVALRNGSRVEVADDGLGHVRSGYFRVADHTPRNQHQRALTLLSAAVGINGHTP
jgi:hypothetical protein